MLQLRALSRNEQQEIERILELDLETLYAELGQQIGVLAPGSNAESQARKWINSRRQKLYELICIKGSYCDFIKQNRNANTVQIVAAVGDLLATALGVLPVNTLSALLFRTSLDRFCNCSKED